MLIQQQQSSTSANHPIDLVQKCRAHEVEEARVNYEEGPKIFQNMKTVGLFQGKKKIFFL